MLLKHYLVGILLCCRELGVFWSNCDSINNHQKHHQKHHQGRGVNDCSFNSVNGVENQQKKGENSNRNEANGDVGRTEKLGRCKETTTKKPKTSLSSTTETKPKLGRRVGEYRKAICVHLKRMCGDVFLNENVVGKNISERKNVSKRSAALDGLLYIQRMTAKWNQPFQFRKKNCDASCSLELDISFIKADQSRRYIFSAMSHSIELPTSIMNYTDKKDSFMKVMSMIFQLVPEMSGNASKKNITLYKQFVSTSLSMALIKPLPHDSMVRIVFKKPKNTTREGTDHQCVYWNGSYTSGEWSRDGCITHSSSNETHTVCMCNHLTDFSVLMRLVPNDSHDMALHWISFIGCGISILFLIITCCIIVFIRKLRADNRYRIHMNLSVALIVGNTLLLMTDEMRKKDDVCFGVSIFLYYFFLAAFCWMLCEAVFIWRGLVLVFNETDKFRYYFLFAWGIPIVLTAVTVAGFQKKMTNYKNCWLSMTGRVYWMFVVPALLIIMINTFILVKAYSILRKQVKKSKSKSFRASIKFTIFLLPLFGSTWVFGALALSKDLKVFQYIFSILNSLQGFFIFLVYMGRSRRVRDAVMRQFMNVKRKRDLSATTVASKKSSRGSRIPLCHKTTVLDD